MRNQRKFEVSEINYIDANTALQQSSKEIFDKLDQLRINLSVRFFKEISSKFYQSCDQLFSSLGNVANELGDLETKDRNKGLQRHERFNEEASYVNQFESTTARSFASQSAQSNSEARFNFNF